MQPKFRCLGSQAAGQPGGRLPLLSTSSTITLSSAKHPLSICQTKLYCFTGGGGTGGAEGPRPPHSKVWPLWSQTQCQMAALWNVYAPQSNSTYNKFLDSPNAASVGPQFDSRKTKCICKLNTILRSTVWTYGDNYAQDGQRPLPNRTEFY